MEVTLQALARLCSGAILACPNPFMSMLQTPYNRLLATLLLALLAGQTPALLASAGATETPTINKAQLNQAVQEALAKQSGGAGAAAGSAAGLSGSASGSTAGSEGLGTSGALSNLTNGGGEEEASTPTTSTSSSTSTSGGVSTGVLLPIFIVGAVLLGGIAFFIVRDARGVAPVVDGFGNAGSAQERAARLRKRRAKAKAARQQRKRNR
jgi:cobalamin biosynthesis Mg chelatase CobN